MNTDKYLEKSLEQLHIKNVRQFYSLIADINEELANLHKSIEHKIEKESYHLVTEYINQFISYTSVWNVKFVSNLENPEVAMLQIFHLDYIFQQESTEHFRCERAELIELKEKFRALEAFKNEHIELRKQKMLKYIASQ